MLGPLASSIFFILIIIFECTTVIIVYIRFPLHKFSILVMKQFALTNYYNTGMLYPYIAIIQILILWKAVNGKFRFSNNNE